MKDLSCYLVGAAYLQKNEKHFRVLLTDAKVFIVEDSNVSE